MIPLHFQPSIETVDGYAGDAIRMTQKVYTVDISSFAPSTLRRVDSVLEEWKTGGAKMEQVAKSIYAFGSFAGEVLLKARHGEWFKPDQPSNEEDFFDYPFLAVRLRGGAVWRPINLGFQIMDSVPNSSYWNSIVDLLGRVPSEG